MHTVRSLHDEAMELAQLALVARHTGDLERASRDMATIRDKMGHIDGRQ